MSQKTEYHMDFNLPVKGNEKLRVILDRVRRSKEIETYWKCCNVTTIDRLGMNDHGPTHIKIISNIALRLYRLLMEAGVTPGIVKDHHMTKEDGEVVVFLTCCLHDIGHIIHRKDHVDYSIAIALNLLPSLLDGVYKDEGRTIVIAETLHAIRAHESDIKPLTAEAEIARLADALDMVKGRARIPFEAGKINIHSVSAMAIDKVEISKGEPPKSVNVEIYMNNSAGIFQVDELLRKKLKDATIQDHIRVTVRIEGKAERRIIEKFEI